MYRQQGQGMKRTQGYARNVTRGLYIKDAQGMKHVQGTLCPAESRSATEVSHETYYTGWKAWPPDKSTGTLRWLFWRSSWTSSTRRTGGEPFRSAFIVLKHRHLLQVVHQNFLFKSLTVALKVFYPAIR